MKRLFVAIPISEAIQKKALEFQKKYHGPTAIASTATNPTLRWLTGKNLHITIIPPWYENDSNRIKNILNKFAEQTAQTFPTGAASRPGPINIRFSDISYGPNLASPRLIWASGQTPGALIQFKKNLETIFLKEKIIQHIEPRPFLLHLTLARFRQEDFKNFTIKKINEQIDWRETLNTFVLMESHLSSAGADYEILQQIKL